MNQNNEKLYNTVVEKLIRFVLHDILFSDIFLNKLEQVTQEFKIQIPVFILFQDSWQEVLVADQFYPSECEVWIK